MIAALFVPRGWVQPSAVADELERYHYLGPTSRGVAWTDERGCLVLSPTTSRRLPAGWLDLTRWCLLHRAPNAGSAQWAEVWRVALARFPNATTVVSYSDPSVGHDGALYRACGWLWAPTWHRLRPPPSGNGSWDGETNEAVKDRWVFLLRPDAEREAMLAVKDDSIVRAHPEWSYREPRWRGGRPRQEGGADRSSWLAQRNAA